MQLSHVWTTKEEATLLIHFDVGKSVENASDNILNYPDEARDISHAVLFLLGGSLLAIVFMPAVAIILTTIVGVGLINKLIPSVLSTVCGSSSKGFFPGRCFAPQLYEIGESLINQDKLDVLTELVDNSIQEVTKHFY